MVTLRRPQQNNPFKWFFWIVVLLIIFVFGVTIYWMYNNTMYMAKNWGGTYTIQTPEDGIHISSTWKGDVLWIETYYPKDNKCVFKQEQTMLGFAEGQVVIQPCNYRSVK